MLVGNRKSGYSECPLMLIIDFGLISRIKGWGLNMGE